MLSEEQNRLLTRTGPGTPGGDLLRRYWQPAALSRELPAGGAPVPVRLLGEDLVLFRDEAGRPGLLGIHCAHRGADLSYGRLEDGGLRCIYHGWLYDVSGKCLEQPGEPVGSTFHERIRQTAYPCREQGGLIFAYLGLDEPPLFPAYEFLNLPDGHSTVNKMVYECNYLQGNEGNIDPAHLSFLHRFLREDPSIARPANLGTEANVSSNQLFGRDPSPTLEIEQTDFGIRIFALRDAGEDNRYVRVTNFIYPNLSAFAGGGRGDGYGVNWHVPIDDERHMKYVIMFNRKDPVDPEGDRRQMEAEVNANFTLRRARENRYLQSRDEMKTRTFIGLGMFFHGHDALATEGPGRIQDRTVEHTGYTDKAIVMQRLLLLKAIGDVQEGRDPPHVIRDVAANRLGHVGALDVVTPNAEDWRTIWQRYLPGNRPALAVV